MLIGGVIAEYDPFHNGHKAHINSLRAAGATHIVAVISGAFTQRGEPAALTKFDRTQLALAGGIDLVLENPLPFAMASAERFATGGVKVLSALGCVDTLSFGSECGDADALCRLAALMETPAYTAALHRALSDGSAYAAASESAAQCGGDKTLAALLSRPNNTLGLEYIRAAQRLKTSFTFHTTTRVGVAHNAQNHAGNIASASHIRALLHTKSIDDVLAFLPSSSIILLQEILAGGRAPADSATLENALLAHLRTMSLDAFAALPYISEGLDNRLYQASRTAGSYAELLSTVKTRRYPAARLRRILWAALLGMPKESVFPQPLYIRVLGMNDRGREILAAAKPTLPILTRAAQISTLSANAQTMIALEERATNLHALTLPVPLPCGTDWTNKL